MSRSATLVLFIITFLTAPLVQATTIPSHALLGKKSTGIETPNFSFSQNSATLLPSRRASLLPEKSRLMKSDAFWRLAGNSKDRAQAGATPSGNQDFQTYVIDTVVAYSSDTTRYSYSYDPYGHFYMQTVADWENGGWANFYRLISSYDHKGHPLAELEQFWADNQWGNYDTVTILYDENGLETSELIEYWQGSQLTNYSRYSYTYDASGNELTDLLEAWDGIEWVNYDLTTSTYDAHNSPVTFLYETWQGSEWVNAERSTLTYDVNGHNVTYLDETWQNSQWTNDDRYSYGYDINGYQVASLYEVWQTSQWMNVDSTSNTYDAHGNSLVTLDETWQGSQWVNQTRDTYTYDTDGRELTWVNEDWETTQFINAERDTLAFDGNGNLALYTHDVWQGSSWSPSIGNGNEDYIFFNSNGYLYQFQGYEVRFTYDLATIAGVQQTNVSIPSGFALLQNYPNPFNPTTNLRFTIADFRFVSLKIFDALGREVAILVNETKKPGQYTVQWDGSGAASGVYFYTLRAGSFIQTKKMVLIK
ncbi:MAG TPA: T9SS type A sorting domain-containing protein [Bacteroidota bacterium]|nr:T9SS type A sorting domain-containing protein [Bacteroidota bacterium]